MTIWTPIAADVTTLNERCHALATAGEVGDTGRLPRMFAAEQSAVFWAATPRRRSAAIARPAADKSLGVTPVRY
jgi:hypothetical protein